jgi:MFS family permease
MSSGRTRTPNYLRFIVTGAIIGFIVGVVIAFAGEATPDYSAGAQLGFFGVVFGGLGALLAGVVAVLLERRP